MSMVALLGLGYLGVSGLQSSAQIPEPSATSFSLFATHPYASQSGYTRNTKNYYTGANYCPDQDFCPAGQRLTSMAVSKNGELIAGYGDWDSNSDTFGQEQGRVGVVPLNLTTKQWGEMVYAGSEALDKIREIDGDLYLTTTDPSHKAPSGQTRPGAGYITNAGGQWHYVSVPVPAEHMLDMAGASKNDLMIFGGASNSEATAWRSTDGGATWQKSLAEGSAEGQSSGYERYYWGAYLNGKYYTQATGTKPQTPVRVYDGRDWGSVDVDISYSCHTLFQEKLICVNKLFNGSATEPLPLPDGLDRISRTYIDNNQLYVMGEVNGETVIYRLKSWADAWEKITTVSTPTVEDHFSSFAVYDDYIYLGANGGRIYKSERSITDMLGLRIDSVNPKSVPLDGKTHDVTVRGVGFEKESSSVLVNNVEMPATVASSEALTARVDTSKLSASDSVVTSITYTTRSKRSVGAQLGLTAVQKSAYTPDACFNFSNGVIGYPYRDYENDDPHQPACPRDVVIPPTINGTPVTEIGWSAFVGKNLTSVVIPEGVVKIEQQAFDGNRSLTKVTLPSTLAEIGLAAFVSCGLESINLPPSLKKIDRQAFYGNKLTSIVIPDSVTEMGGSVFSDNQITEVTLSKNLTTIPQGAFFGNKLTSITIPEGVTTIEYAAFMHNELTSVSLPSTLTDMSGTAFGYNRLTDFVIPSSVTNLGHGFQFAYNNLYSFTVPARAFESIPKDWQPYLVYALMMGQSEISWRDTQEFQWNSDASSLEECGAYAHPDVCRAYFGDDASQRYVQLFIDAPDTGDTRSSVMMSEGKLLGGVILNPRPVTVSYVDENGKALAPAETFTGEFEGKKLTDYLVKNGPTFAHQADYFDGWETIDATYYRDGATATAAAKEFAGYDLVSPQSQSITVDKNTNTIVFTYKKHVEPSAPIETLPTPPNSSDPKTPAETPATPNTGVQMLAAGVALPIFGVITLGALALKKRLS